MNQQKLATLIEKEIHTEELFISGLEPGARAATGTLENWSAKDLLAHLNFWKHLLGTNLEALSAGTPLREPAEDDIENEATFYEFKEKSWEEVTAFVDDANNLLLSQVRGIDPGMLEAEGLFPWEGLRPLWRNIAGTGYLHPVVHLVEHAMKEGNQSLARTLSEGMAEDLSALDDTPTWLGTVQYNLACYYALTKDSARAVETLTEALALNPELIEWSKQDSDLDSIRSEPGYIALVGG